MNVNFDINAMLKSVIENFQNIARNVKISFKIRRLNDDNHRFNGEYGENRFTALTFINKRQSPACFRAGGIFNNDTGRNLYVINVKLCYYRRARNGQLRP